MKMYRLKLTACCILLAFVAVFAVQNAELVQYRILTGTVELRRSVVVAMSLLLGIVIGWLAGTTKSKRK